MRSSWSAGLIPPLIILFSVLCGPAAAQMYPGPDSGPGTMGSRFQKRKPPDPEKMLEKQFEEICKYLELTPSQEKQARKYFDSRRRDSKKVVKAMSSGSLAPAEGQDSLRTILADYREKFDRLITVEQRSKLEKWSQERMGREIEPGARPMRDGMQRERYNLGGYGDRGETGCLSEPRPARGLPCSGSTG